MRSPSFRAPARLAVVVVLAAVLLAPVGSIAFAATDPYGSTSVGYDVSYPDCGKLIGPTASDGKPYAFAVVGVTGGKPFTTNGCLASEYQTAIAKGFAPSLYLNTAAPIGSTAKTYETKGPKACARTDTVCLAYNYGYQTAIAAHTYASSQSVASSAWWLDVETTNSWSHNTAANTATLQGAIDALTAQGIANVGVYSVQSEWTKITGSAPLGVPVWVAGALSLGLANQLCTASFTGGPVWLVQYYNATLGYDEDYAC